MNHDSGSQEMVTDGSGEKSDRRKKIDRATAAFRKDSRATVEDVKSSPTGAIVAGAVVIGAGLILGPAEAALGGVAGLVVYRILKKQRDGARALPSSSSP